jgi:sugar-specific transcriptional regulator TrmB
MDEDEAVDALTRLGLRMYEARVFIALQKLGTGSASDVAEVADVPRSQVYGAAEGLQDRGLLEVEESRPTVYRPVPPQAAERKLLAQLESTGREAFDYLEHVRDSYADEEEESEALWTVRGASTITERAVELIGDADSRVVYAVDDPVHMEDIVLAALSSVAREGVLAVVVSENPDVLAAVEDDAIETVEQPSDHLPEVSTARLLLIDDDTILLSVDSPDADREIAFWSAGTAFARALNRLSVELFATDPF